MLPHLGRIAGSVRPTAAIRRMAGRERRKAPTAQVSLSWKEHAPVELDRLLTVSDVADVLAVSPRTVWRLVREDGALPVVRVRGGVRVRLSDVEAYIADQLVTSNT